MFYKLTKTGFHIQGINSELTVANKILNTLNVLTNPTDVYIDSPVNFIFCVSDIFHDICTLIFTNEYELSPRNTHLCTTIHPTLLMDFPITRRVHKA